MCRPGEMYLAGPVRIEGMERVLTGLNSRILGVQNRTIAGLLAGGLIIQGEAQRRVPVEYGKLRASAFTRKTPENPNAVEVGFSAAYALFVHENMEQVLKGEPRPSGLGVYWGPNGQPKFLEGAARDKSDVVLKSIASYARVTS